MASCEQLLLLPCPCGTAPLASLQDLNAEDGGVGILLSQGLGQLLNTNSGDSQLDSGASWGPIVAEDVLPVGLPVGFLKCVLCFILLGVDTTSRNVQLYSTSIA